MYVSMKEMLRKANEGNYAVMAINCFNLETVRAVITSAELEKCTNNNKYSPRTFINSL